MNYKTSNTTNIQPNTNHTTPTTRYAAPVSQQSEPTFRLRATLATARQADMHATRRVAQTNPQPRNVKHATNATCNATSPTHAQPTIAHTSQKDSKLRDGASLAGLAGVVKRNQLQPACIAVRSTAGGDAYRWRQISLLSTAGNLFAWNLHSH